MTDGNIETYWAVEDDNLTPTAVITLPKPATFDIIRLREQTRLGQRVDSFNIDAFVNGKWVCIDNEGKTIGNQVMRRLNRPITTQKLRLRITGSQATPCISEFSLFRQPAGAVRPSIFRRGDNLVIIADGKIKSCTRRTAANPRQDLPFTARVLNLRKAALSRLAANSPMVNWALSARPNSASAKPDGK